MFSGVYTYPTILFSTENGCRVFIYGVDFDVARFNGMGMRRPQIEKRATGRGSRFFFSTSPINLSHIITLRNPGFMTAITMEPIGTIIKQELERQERTITWFASKLHCNRANVYNIFSRNNIDIALLIRISKILNRNFVREIADQIDDDAASVLKS